MKTFIYLVLLVTLWATLIPALNALNTAPTEIRIWFIAINIVVSARILIDLHSAQQTQGERGPRGYTGKNGTV